MTENPITSIEDKKGNEDCGRLAYRMYAGAIDEGANPIEAALVVTSFFEGMFRSVQSTKEEEDDES